MNDTIPASQFLKKTNLELSSFNSFKKHHYQKIIIFHNPDQMIMQFLFQASSIN